MSDTLKTDLDTAERFLRWAHPAGPWVLTSIPVEGGKTTTETFFDMGAVRGWVGNVSGKQNVYFTVNRIRGAMDVKPKKEHVEEAVMLHIDIDPKKPRDGMSDAELDKWNADEQARILKLLEDFSPSPSAVTFSGGGYQGFWMLDEPLYIGGDANRISELEAYNKQLGIVLGGDNTFNIDRIMRLPGTINLPDAKKRKKGRKPALAKLVWDNGPVHPLHNFTPAPPEAKVSGAGAAVQLPDNVALIGVDDLPADLPERLRNVIVHGEDPDKPGHFPSDSEALYYVTCKLVVLGFGDEFIAGVLRNPELGISRHALAKNRGLDYVARQIQRARDDVGDTRPRIIWSETELARCLNEAEAAMIKSDVHIYSMGDRLVQPIRLDAERADSDNVRRAAGSLVIAGISKHRLLEHMLTSADFLKRTRDRKGNVIEAPFAPKIAFAEHYIGRAGAWRLPVLAGIATAPTMRQDGSIVWEDGYDPASRIIVDTQGVAFPPVPIAPTRGEARTALDTLIDLISEFPFVSDDDSASPSGTAPSQSRSVALAMILTAVARPAFRSAPMFGISAPTMATGKSLLADIPAMIVTGRRATKMSQGASEEEDEKRLLSVLMRGDPINVIDNIARPVSGDAICTILTEETWRCRILTRSEMRDVPTKAVFIATGNNLAFREDMSSRAVLVSLDAEVENPGEREFRRDLKSYVPEHRAELAVAALTALRGYIRSLLLARPGGGIDERWFFAAAGDADRQRGARPGRPIPGCRPCRGRGGRST